MKGLETTMETKNTYQAPAIDNSGKGYRPKGWKNYGNAIIDGYLLQKIGEVCGEKHFSAYKLLIFLISNADGFRATEKTVCERCRLSTRGYRKARKFLKENNFILVYNGTIEVNYRAIYEFVDEQEIEEMATIEAINEYGGYKNKEDYFGHCEW